MESETLIVSGQESFIALSDSNWTTLKNTEAYLACLKTGIIDVNIKRALNIVMERDSKNPTPTIDTEPLLLEGLVMQYRNNQKELFSLQIKSQ